MSVITLPYLREAITVNSRYLKVDDHSRYLQVNFWFKKIYFRYQLYEIKGVQKELKAGNLKQEICLNCSLCREYFENQCLRHQGQVVQSIISLTSLLRGQLIKCFTTL